MKTRLTIAMVLACLAIGACAAPEAIVVEAAEAAADGDEGRFLACFTRRSRAMLQAMWDIAGTDNAHYFRLAAGRVDVQESQPMPPGILGETRAKVTVSEGAARMSLVVHSVGGAWRIDLIDTERSLTGFGMPF